MYQVDDPTAVASPPASTALGTVGYFTDGNPATNSPATILRAEFMNSLMRELLAILTAASITPSKNTFNQLATALIPGHLISTNGYQKFSGGLIIQWGVYSFSSSSSITVTFPLAFPNNVLIVGPFSPNATTTINSVTPTLTNVTLTTSSSITGSGYWIAIGN